MFPSGKFAPAAVVSLRAGGFGEHCGRLRLLRTNFSMIVIIACLISVTAFIFHSERFSLISK